MSNMMDMLKQFPRFTEFNPIVHINYCDVLGEYNNELDKKLFILKIDEQYYIKLDPDHELKYLIHCDKDRTDIINILQQYDNPPLDLFSGNNSIYYAGLFENIHALKNTMKNSHYVYVFQDIVSEPDIEFVIYKTVYSASYIIFFTTTHKVSVDDKEYQSLFLIINHKNKIQNDVYATLNDQFILCSEQDLLKQFKNIDYDMMQYINVIFSIKQNIINAMKTIISL